MLHKRIYNDVFIDFQYDDPDVESYCFSLLKKTKNNYSEALEIIHKWNRKLDNDFNPSKRNKKSFLAACDENIKLKETKFFLDKCNFSWENKNGSWKSFG